MTESIIVVAVVILIFGLFGLMARKAEKVVKARKLEEQKAAVLEASAKSGGKTKKR